MRELVSAIVLSPLYRTKFRVFTGKAYYDTPFRDVQAFDVVVLFWCPETHEFWHSAYGWFLYG